MTDSEEDSTVVSNALSDSSDKYMLTTTDNPFNPFEDFDNWFAFDEQEGYHTCSYLARVAGSSEELSDEDENLSIRQAIDEIVELNITGNYVKVTKESWFDRSQSSKQSKTDNQ